MYEIEPVLVDRNDDSDRTWEWKGCCGSHETVVSKIEKSSLASL